MVGGEFEVAGVGEGGHEMGQGHAGEGAVVDFGVGGDLFNFGDAAGPGQVGVEDIGGVELEYFLEAPAGEDALAGGDGDAGAFAASFSAATLCGCIGSSMK